MARLFIAVQPTEEVLDALAALPRPDDPGVRWTRREHWHVTLRFLGEADPEEAAEALAGLDQPETEALLGPAVSRVGRFVVAIPVQGLDELAAAVRALTAGIGEPPDPRPFTGHLTLARLGRRAACGLAGAPFSARFPVREVELLRSTLTAEGPIHEVIARRPLRPR
ncbi:RNA 2',3'-cyclic phosphodiesterase [Rhabdothermincola sediminis]|uniref:RNA 2',3'-cyclic phosphodiesterase n=1 Tax=Rhabdothermincola sediminis TaxID=2751370 RepID=UPI001AA08045|nr:RNA 2',3'-cyclic phosphodiesterase [Rhabdothermincola sediminis]